MNNLPETLSITMYKGVPLSFDVTLKDDTRKPMDLTDWSFSAEVRWKPGNSALVGNIDVSAPEPRTSGVLTLTFGEELALALPAPATVAADLRMTKPGVASVVPLRIVIIVEASVTRPTGA